MIRDIIHHPVAVPCVVFLTTLLCYVVTIPHSITLEDAGLFQMICHNGGIGHPPGYPLFVLTCQQFVALPFFSDDVFAANFLSSVYASSACALLYVVSKKVVADELIAFAIAIAFGLSSTFWSQAIIVEVYSLAVLMFLASLLFAMRFVESESIADLFWLAVIFGLSLANHWPLQLLATPALLAILAPRWQFLLSVFRKPGLLLLLLAGFGAGLLPYVSLVQETPAFAVYGAVDSVEQFVRYVLRSAYSDESELAGWQDRWQYQVWLFSQSLSEIHLVLAPLILAGLYRSFSVASTSVALALVFIYLSGTTLLNLLLGFEYNEFRVAIFAPYPIVAYLSLAIWMGLGLQWLMVKLPPTLALIKAGAPLLVCLLTFLGNYPTMASTQNSFAQLYGERVLQQVQEDSVLFVEGDSGVGLIGYLHYVRGDRPDIELRSWNNLVFPNRLASPFTPGKIQNDRRSAFIAESDKPVFSTSHGAGTLNHGLVFQHNEAAGFRYDPGMNSYIEYLVQLEQSNGLRNGHERDLLFQLLSTLTRQRLAISSTLGETQNENLMLDALSSTWPGKLAILELGSLVNVGESEKARLRGLGEELHQSLPVLASRQLKGNLAAYRGRLELQGDSELEAAKTLLEASVTVFPHANNPAVCPLLSTYRQLGLHSAPDAMIKTPEAVTCE